MFHQKLREFNLTPQEFSYLLSVSLKTLENSIIEKNELYERSLELLNNPVELIERIKIMTPVFGKKRVQQLVNLIDNIITSKLQEAIPGFVFIKQVKSNELGFRNGVPGQAGSFILAPKNSIGFFPVLSDSIMNDSREITVTIMPENEERKLEFVYHNSKYTDNDPTGRDEYRIYNRNFINGNVLLQPEDLVLLTKVGNLKYNLYRVTQNNNMYHNILKVTNENKESRAISAIVPIVELIKNNIRLNDLVPENSNTTNLSSLPRITEEEYESSDFDIYNNILQLAQNELKSEDIDTVVRKINQIKRDQRFKKVILYAYERSCAISELSISFGGITNIQACHIIGKAEQGSDNPKNGIALDMNLHWAFDNGMITITNEYRVLVHDLLKDNAYLMRYQGKKIKLPKDEDLWPSFEALEYHQNNTFGKFSKK